MQFKNPFIDNLSKVMADAFGAAHSAKNEAENVFKTWLDGWLADRDFVTREEFEALNIQLFEEATDCIAPFEGIDENGFLVWNSGSGDDARQILQRQHPVHCLIVIDGND